MSRKFARCDALEDISTWSSSDVLHLLRKNGLEECCKAVAKRKVDGDELLHLTEGKLALWKSDLTRPLIWNLWKFVEDVKTTPEKYVEAKISETQRNEDHLSDTGSWGTDFEDELNEESVTESKKEIRPYSVFSSSQKTTEQCASQKVVEATSGDIISQVEDDGTYANCESIQEDGSTYANFHETKKSTGKNVSRLHSHVEKSLAEQLKEQLQLRNIKKPMVRPKPEVLASRKSEPGPALQTQPQKSFLHNASKVTNGPPNQTQKRMSVPPPPEPSKINDSAPTEKPTKELQKASVTIRNLDLLANLPPRTEESEDEYEPFDEQIIEQNQKKSISRVSSKQSLTSGHRSSAESVYQPPSITSHEEEEEPYEIYESITETPNDDGYYLSPVQRIPNVEPPPLPSKPPLSSKSPSPNLNRSKTEPAKARKKVQDALRKMRFPPPYGEQMLLGGLGLRLADEVSDMIVRIKRGLSTCCYSHPPEPPERSPEKKSATLPHSSSNSSILTERATRPLPPPPDRQSYTDQPWFHNITREQAAGLIKEQSTYGNPQDGYFLLRPSTTNINNPLALVLWYRDRVYNVPVRKRPDNRYALGTAKVNEQSFASVEEIVTFYSREELVLHTGGSTKLTDSPPK